MLSTRKTLYALDDVCIIPAAYSRINSRKECIPIHEDGKLPIFTAPMTAVIDETNYRYFMNHGVHAIIPRNIELDKRIEFACSGIWAAFSLNEFQEFFIDNASELTFTDECKCNVLIDIANGHMSKLCKMITESKVMMRMDHPDINYKIMAGNVANPDTYRNLSLSGADYVRVSIGSGQCCITSSNVGVHYPMASLIDECYQLKEQYRLDAAIVADGGINSYNRAITALALGADYVMIGTTFAGCYESAAEFYAGDTLCQLAGLPGINAPEDEKKKYLQTSKEQYGSVIKRIYGMSTRAAQCAINQKCANKTSEGIHRTVEVKYTLEQWLDNFKAYLKSAMSYCGKATLYEFIGEVETRVMSPIAKQSFNQ